MEPRAVIVADTEGVICYWSPGAEALFGHAPPEAIGRTLDLLVPDSHRSRHWVGFRKAMAISGKIDPGGIVSVPVRKASGEVERFAVRIVVLTDAWGTSTGAVAVFAPLSAQPPATEPLYEL